MESTSEPMKIQISHTTMELLEELGVLAMLTPMPRGGVSHVCLPSTLVAMMHRDYPREFRLRFGADTAVLREFWRFLSEAPDQSLGSEPPLPGQQRSGRSGNHNPLHYALGCRALHQEAELLLHILDLYAGTGWGEGFCLFLFCFLFYFFN